MRVHHVSAHVRIDMHSAAWGTYIGMDIDTYVRPCVWRRLMEPGKPGRGIQAQNRVSGHRLERTTGKAETAGERAMQQTASRE
jgi:hypothetical protein